jgi:hypothetical protein
LKVNTTEKNIKQKKIYTQPLVGRFILDKSISLVMMTTPPVNPPGPRGGGTKGTDTPFESPFGDKPFS